MKIKIKERYRFGNRKRIRYLIEDLFILDSDLDDCKLITTKLGRFSKMMKFLKILKYKLQKTIPLDIKCRNEDTLITPLANPNFGFNFLLNYGDYYFNTGLDILLLLCKIKYKEESIYRTIVYEAELKNFDIIQEELLHRVKIIRLEKTDNVVILSNHIKTILMYFKLCLNSKIK